LKAVKIIFILADFVIVKSTLNFSFSVVNFFNDHSNPNLYFQADTIIAELETTLKTSGFKLEPPLVEIMSGRDEGLYAWFTVNYLLDLLSPGLLKKSFASLDLGGGSTQITFVPEKIPVPGLKNRKHFMHKVKRKF
jgi:hypothetical protein